MSHLSCSLSLENVAAFLIQQCDIAVTESQVVVYVT